MTMHTLYCASYHPRIHMAEIEGKRRAQIVATLMAERFPSFAFGYAPSPIVTSPNTNHFLEIGLGSLEVVRLTEQQLEAEATDNPEGLEKWLMFIFDDGKGPNNGPRMSCYLEHDQKIVRKCKADPTLAKIIPFYGDQPNWEDLERRLHGWTAEQSESPRPARRFNCLSDDAEIAHFSTFYVAPCRDDKSQCDDDGTEIVQCAAGDAQFWTIYGSDISDNGCQWLAVHDAYSATEIVRIARQINAETGKPFFYRDETHGCIPQHGARLDFCEIAEALTEAIHDDLPDLAEDGFARVDDFDAHPLAEMREAFVTFSNYSGLATAAAPYHPWEGAA
jgi:hypothetical protein